VCPRFGVDRTVPAAGGSVPSHRDDEPAELLTGEDGSRRARWTLGVAVAGSLLLVGVTAFLVRLGSEPEREEPPPVSLTEPWEPPLRSESEPARSEAPPLSVTQASVAAVVDLSAVGLRD
jgi:hypothetical protein